MPPFERHLRAGLVVHAVVVFPIVVGVFTEVWSRQIGLLAAVGTLPGTLGGSIVPDADHPSSRPYRLAYRWLPVVAAGTVALLLV
ncbi:hypothetical protein EKH57_00170 (plasmid) [Halorubrum sp. BOL3-1]|uniref:hypothetical protein n=1 Tax=Halorubrum sp. BOL3-1 TaxID=2497325 RepID=UPI001004E766|nr:hypothetical protein [Halorubrum sp. BOL3-1]QAU11344.1 hypothetical protein EKH57_00170 [Halorubrum sp. BOL3-1]